MTAAEDRAHSSNWSQATLLTRPIRALLRLSQREALFETRGFPESNSSTQFALEAIGRVFVNGYNVSLTARDVGPILQYVNSIPVGERGFAAEGAAMGAAIGDALPMAKPMLPACIAAFNSEFGYLTHVGAGWALARVPWRRSRILGALDPLLRWLAIDGLGFHDTYFYHRSILAGWRRERSGYSAQAYDQGVGRALWFVSGGSAFEAARLISTVASDRQNELWSGLGLAMAYAGPAADQDFVSARKAAGASAAFYAQGVAFACEARTLAGHVPRHTDAAATSVWGLDAGEVAELVRDMRDRLPKVEADPPRYQTWRKRVAVAFTQGKGRMP
jgi:enediyne biosynthesis protein E3